MHGLSQKQCVCKHFMHATGRPAPAQRGTKPTPFCISRDNYGADRRRWPRKKTGGPGVARPEEATRGRHRLRRRLCATVNVAPAIVIVPVRDWFVVFAATEYVTVPVPIALAPLVTVIHDALDAAVHEHALSDAVTVTIPLAAGDVTLALAGDSENVHVGGGGSVGGGGGAGGGGGGGSGGGGGDTAESGYGSSANPARHARNGSLVVPLVGQYEFPAPMNGHK